MRFLKFALIFYLCSFQLQGKEFTPTSLYQDLHLVGFKIKVHPDLVKNELYPIFKQEAKTQLNKIVKAIPSKQLEKLRKIAIWAEWNNKEKGAAEFHPSKQWLILNHYNPDKEKAIELSNAKNFIRWSQTFQPWMIFHEFAHAYHNIYLGFDHPEIEKAYQNAMDHKLYDSVLHADGKKRKAYATTNKKEYFAEISEAFFGENDFFPFNTKDLQQHDPIGYEVLIKLWNK